MTAHRLNPFPVLALGLMAVAFGVVGHTRQAQAQNAKDDLQGKWTVVVVNQFYYDLLSKTETPTVQFHEKRVTLALADKSITGPFQLDATKKTKQFEMVLFSFLPNNNVWWGIYKIENGLLHLYAERMGENPRPAFFDITPPYAGATFILKPEGARLTPTQERDLRERRERLTRIAVRKTALNNLKQIGLAMHNYHAVYNGFPAAAICDKKTGKPLLSWRVSILPYIEQEALYKQFKMDEPWDSEHNLKLAKNMPNVYFHPIANKPGDNKTHYRVFYGNGALFELNKPTELPSIADGASNTILTVEAEDPVLWTNPNDLAFDPAKPLPKLLNTDGQTTICWADGSVYTFNLPGDPKTLNLLIQKADGNVIPKLP